MQQHVSPEPSRDPLWLSLGSGSASLAIAVVLRRLVELIPPPHGSPPQMASLNATFSSHTVMTAMDIIPPTRRAFAKAGAHDPRRGCPAPVSQPLVPSWEYSSPRVPARILPPAARATPPTGGVF